MISPIWGLDSNVISILVLSYIYNRDGDGDGQTDRQTDRQTDGQTDR